MRSRCLLLSIFVGLLGAEAVRSPYSVVGIDSGRTKEDYFSESSQVSPASVASAFEESVTLSAFDQVHILRSLAPPTGVYRGDHKKWRGLFGKLKFQQLWRSELATHWLKVCRSGQEYYKLWEIVFVSLLKGESFPKNVQDSVAGSFLVDLEYTMFAYGYSFSPEAQRELEVFLLDKYRKVLGSPEVAAFYMMRMLEIELHILNSVADHMQYMGESEALLASVRLRIDMTTAKLSMVVWEGWMEWKKFEADEKESREEMGWESPVGSVFGSVAAVFVNEPEVAPLSSTLAKGNSGDDAPFGVLFAQHSYHVLVKLTKQLSPVDYLKPDLLCKQQINPLGLHMLAQLMFWAASTVGKPLHCEEAFKEVSNAMKEYARSRQTITDAMHLYLQSIRSNPFL